MRVEFSEFRTIFCGIIKSFVIIFNFISEKKALIKLFLK